MFYSSASYAADHEFLNFWEQPDAVCLTSFYAADETRRNCVGPAHLERLEALLEKTHLVSDATSYNLLARFSLPARDQPILAAALQSGADYLVTGDKRHFAQWMNLPVPARTGAITIVQPRALLQLLAQGA